NSAGIHEILEEGKSALEEVNSEVLDTENKIHEELESTIDPDVLLAEAEAESSPSESSEESGSESPSRDQAG
ncbi:MAG: hypothetical protein OQK78_12700, partial [Gammaproteobacteria bacterium]|nr:hypothetical protein [Gammaproteobacteria bacterium]